MKYLIYILLVFIGFGTKAQGTYTISGMVTDEKWITLPGATVFIADSRKAAATNNEGKFIFDGIQPGTYNLVVKMLGFNTYNQSVIIQKEPAVLAIKLQAGSIVLKTVTISGLSAEDRKKYLEIFTKNLLGESDNALQCKLLNPNVVNFTFNKNKRMLEASSDEFLIIEDKALGYKIHYLLANFKWMYRELMEANEVSYNGSLYFEELSGSASQQKKWEKARQLAYEGSILHFFRSAFNNTLAEQGFLIYRYPNSEAIQRYIKQQKRANNEYYLPGSYFQPLRKMDQFFTAIDDDFKLFNLAQLKKDSTELYIIYNKRNEPDVYINSGRRIRPPFFKKQNRDGQISIIQPVLDSMVVEKNGNINPPYSIFRLGYWTWGRTADFLPSDYEPPHEDAIISKK